MQSAGNQPGSENYLPATAHDQALASGIPEQYEVLGKVSEGGMGSIYKVRNKYTAGCFALKLLRQDAANREVSRQRFVMEAKAAGALQHPHICRIHDFGMKDGKPYLVMEWIDGINLHNKIRRDGPLSVAEALPIFQQVSAALAHAHQKNVVHRDLKPDNVMLSRQSSSGRMEVHLVDFGIAKMISEEQYSEALTVAGTIIGSPLYMSPEQARGKEVDGRSDIYSLGCTMYMAMTGNPPFRGDSYIDVIDKHLNSQPPAFDPKLNIPSDLQKIILKALEKNTQERYQTMDRLACDLAKVAKGQGIGPLTLSADEQRKRGRLTSVALFVAGFIAIYSISMVLQNFLDAHNTSAADKSTTPASK